MNLSHFNCPSRCYGNRKLNYPKHLGNSICCWQLHCLAAIFVGSHFVCGDEVVRLEWRVCAGAGSCGDYQVSTAGTQLSGQGLSLLH